MKLIRNISIVLALALAFTACEEADSVKDLGFPVIYIPQATVTGLDNSYPIPLGPLNQHTNYCCRYDGTTGNLDINLGVLRAGFIKDQKAFSVDLRTCPEQTQKKLDEYAAKEVPVPAVAIPAEVCTIPEKISVEAGKNSATCYVSVNIKELAKQQASLLAVNTYKLLVLGLEIANPTTYELAENNTSVVIILDLNSENWDGLDPSVPESAVRGLFPKTE